MEQKNQPNNNMVTLLKEPDFDRVLVACHRSPDGDACGSALALTWALRKMGKQAAVYCADPFGKEFSYLTQWETEKQDWTPERVITVDVADPSMLVNVELAARIDACIDHHRINSVVAKEKWVDPTASSCGELILELILALGLTPDRKIAMALYTAIATDTGLCRYSNTNERTFRSLAYLYPLAEEGDFYQINKLLFETKSRTQLALESFAIREMAFAAEGRIAYLSVSLARQEELKASYEQLNGLISVIRQVEGVEAALVMKERESGEWKVSVRSEKSFDASAFCAHFGGGGHLAAAGCTLQGEEKEVLQLLIAKAEGSFH